MIWIFYSLAAAAFESIKDSYSKASLLKTNEITAGMVLHAVTFILILPIILLTGIPELKSSFWYGSAAFLLITPAWTILYMRALKLSELSKVIPLMALNPIFTAALAFLFDSTPISSSGWLGIGLISAGMYVANIDLKLLRKDLLQPIKNIVKDKGAVAMLGVALLWSLGAHFGKMRVDGSSPLFSTFTGGLIGVVTTWLIAQYSKEKIQFRDLYKHKKELLPVGIFYFLANILSSFALQSGTATYVFAIKRGSIVASLFTGKLFFGEKISLNKLIGVICISLGVLMLIILG
jgi:uncharacterized membrane protein